MRLSSAAQMRECDRLTIEAVGLPGIALMESAGRAAAARLVEMLAARSLNVAHVALFCGGGNNGGDGFVIARELLRAGHRAEVYLLAPRARLQGDAEVNLRVLERLLRDGLTPGTGAVHRWGDRLAAQTPIAALIASLPKADLVVDAVLGTGLSSAVRAPLDAVIGHINAPGVEPDDLTCERLSRERARAVWEFLVTSGVAPTRLEIRGRGRQDMLFPNPSTPEEVDANRRITLQVIDY